MARIFISYSSTDRVWVRRLVADLKELGFSPWIDEWEINVGESIPLKVQDGISSSELLVVVLSKRSVESGWVQREWGAKFSDEIRTGRTLVLPALIEDCAIPTLLGDKKYADFRLNYSIGLVQLTTSLLGRNEMTPQARRLSDSEQNESVGASLQQASNVAPSPALSVESSGDMILLEHRFYTSQSILEDGDQILLKLVSKNAEEDSQMRVLRGMRKVGFAYGSSGGIAECRSVTGASTGETVWTIELAPQVENSSSFADIGFNGQSSDDIAKLRASRILLNDPPPVDDGSQRARPQGMMQEAMLRGFGDSRVEARMSLLPPLWQQMRHGPQQDFLRAARLTAIFHLKAAGVVEHVLQFRVGPLNGDVLRLEFKGTRRRTYTNVEPELIEVVGNCDLRGSQFK